MFNEHPKRHFVVHTCPHCGTPFSRSRHSPYCSRDCAENEGISPEEADVPSGLFLKIPNGRMMRDLGLAENRKLS